MARTSVIALVAAGALLALAASPALAGPNEDYTGVKRNWLANNSQYVTPCRFSESQLFYAYMVSLGVPEDNYTTFRDAAAAEYRRVKGGGCVELRPGVGAVRDSKVRLAAKPNKLVAGKSKRITFTATTIVNGKRQAIKGASVTFDGKTATTDKGGRVRMREKFSTPGRRRATVTFEGLKPGKANVQVERAKKKSKKKKKKKK
jgi:hypothetical protein